MKKNLILAVFILVGAMEAYAQEDTLAAQSADYLTTTQIDGYWYLADTADHLEGVVTQISKSGVYVTAVLPTADPKRQVLVCFDWHTGRIERYQLMNLDGRVLYTFQRQTDDSFLSTDATGFSAIPLKKGKQEELVTFCRVTVIGTATVLILS